MPCTTLYTCCKVCQPKAPWVSGQLSQHTWILPKTDSSLCTQNTFGKSNLIHFNNFTIVKEIYTHNSKFIIGNKAKQ